MRNVLVIQSFCESAQAEIGSNSVDIFLTDIDRDVIEIEEGNNVEEILKTMLMAKELTGKGKPIAVLMKTIMGNGVDFMMHTHEWHGIAPNDEQLEIALSQNPETLGDY